MSLLTNLTEDEKAHYQELKELMLGANSSEEVRYYEEKIIEFFEKVERQKQVELLNHVQFQLKNILKNLQDDNMKISKEDLIYQLKNISSSIESLNNSH